MMKNTRLGPSRTIHRHLPEGRRQQRVTTADDDLRRLTFARLNATYGSRSSFRDRTNRPPDK
jgi:hypothetical protein